MNDIEFTGHRPTLREIARMHRLNPPDDRHAIVIDGTQGVQIVFPATTVTLPPWTAQPCRNELTVCTDPACLDCWRHRRTR